jgi:HKD family nuclease
MDFRGLADQGNKIYSFCVFSICRGNIVCRYSNCIEQNVYLAMQLLTNAHPYFHKSVITDLLAKAEEVIISVAFLKVSGLKSLEKILETRKRKCTFFIGTDYYLTEPAAIKWLVSNNQNVFVVKKMKSTFHPKLYYFRSGKQVSVVVGSANLTDGGLATNFEVSACFQTSNSSDIEKQFRLLINDYNEFSTRADELYISQYERKYNLYHDKQKKAKQEFDKELKELHEIDLTKLDKYLKEYHRSGGEEQFQERVSQYKHARLQLNRLAKAKIESPTQFLEYYDDIATSFYSSGLLRGKKTFSKKYKAILDIIYLVKENRNASPEVLFSKALIKVKSIKKYGVNGLTELMNTINPQRFSVANGRTLASIADLGLSQYPTANNFKAENYREYNNLIIAIAKRCSFSNLAQVDHFLSFYYSKHVKRKKAQELLNHT